MTRIKRLIVGVCLALPRLVWAQADGGAVEPAPAAEIGASADEDLMEMLSTDVDVWVATKTARKLQEAPAIVTVISGPEIRDWGYQSVAEVLSHVLGFYVIDDHLIPNVAVRGISSGLFGESSAIKVMLNGHSVAFRTTGGNWLGPELVPLSAVQRIEVIRGPASALFGADAFLGVVNIVTRTGEQLSGADLRVAGGSVGERNGMFDLDAALGSRRGEWEVVAAARMSEDDRSGIELPRSSPAPVIPLAHDGQRAARGLVLSSKTALASVTRYFSNGGSMTISPYFSMIDRGGEFASWAQLSNGLDSQGRRSGTTVSLVQGSASLSVKWPVSEKLRLNFDSTFFSGAPTARDRIDVGSELYYVKRRFSFMGLDSTLEGSWSSDPLSFVGGLSLGYDLERLPTNTRVLLGPVGDRAAGNELDDVRAGQSQALINPGVYLQALWSPPIKSLSLTGGVRYDFHNIYGSQLSGRVAAVWNPYEGLTLKLLYGNAFKAPSPFLLYAVPLRSGDVVGNRELQAQHVNTLELEVMYRFNKQLSLRTDVSGSSLANAADFTQVGVNRVASNVANISVLSWETRLDYQSETWRAYLQGELVGTMRDVGETGYKADLVGTQNGIYPSFMIHLGGARKIPKLPLRLAMEMAWVGPRRASDSNMLEAGAAYTLPGFVRLEGNLSTVDLHWLGERRTEIKLIARNLLGATGPDPGFAGVDYPLTPRTLMLQLLQEL
jgi:outer membrane receptor for ferrienterochelin and colicins